MFQIEEERARNYHPSNYNGKCNRQNYKSQDVVFTVASKNGTLIDDIWICDSGACEHYCKFIEGMFDVKGH